MWGATATPYDSMEYVNGEGPGVQNLCYLVGRRIALREMVIATLEFGASTTTSPTLLGRVESARPTLVPSASLFPQTDNRPRSGRVLATPAAVRAAHPC